MQGKGNTTATKATGGKTGGAPPAVNIDNLTREEAAAYLKKLNLKENELKTKQAANKKLREAVIARFPDLAGGSGAQKAASHAGGGAMGTTKGAGKPAGAGAR